MPTKDENASPHNDPILFLNQEPESNTPSSTTREAGRTAHCFVLCILLPTHPREKEGSIIIQTKVCWAEPKTVLEKQAGNHSGSRGGDDICLKQKAIRHQGKSHVEVYPQLVSNPELSAQPRQTRTDRSGSKLFTSAICRCLQHQGQDTSRMLHSSCARRRKTDGFE